MLVTTLTVTHGHITGGHRFHSNSEVKLGRVRVVLWLGTTREGRMLCILFDVASLFYM